MNLKMMIASHWKIAFLILQLSLIAATIAIGHVVVAGEPIDNPGTPI